jgi:large subunit ribosomal protein L22
MDIKAEQKYLLLSPRKIRPVVSLIKKMKPQDAVLQLPFIGKKAAEPLVKVIKQALANARNKGVSEETLIFKEIQIGEGPRLKRGRPIAKGQWYPIKKRMSHIRVILTTKSEISTTESVTHPKSEIKSKDERRNPPTPKATARHSGTKN